MDKEMTFTLRMNEETAMGFKSDIEIAQACEMKDIRKIAEVAGVEEDYLEQYGRYKAKIDLKLLDDRQNDPDGKLILVTAINPTPAGEGKTTTTVGLADALRRLGKKSIVALREPSLGPVFGLKGGAAGGGYSQAFYRRLSCHWSSQQPAGCHAGSSHPSGQCSEYRSQTHHMAPSRGYE